MSPTQWVLANAAHVTSYRESAKPGPRERERNYSKKGREVGLANVFWPAALHSNQRRGIFLYIRQSAYAQLDQRNLRCSHVAGTLEAGFFAVRFIEG